MNAFGVDTESNDCSVRNRKLSLVGVDKGKHGVEWLMNSFVSRFR